MNAEKRTIADDVILEVWAAGKAANATAVAPAAEVGCVEKPQGFFNELGAPGTGPNVEKPGGLFNSNPSRSVSHVEKESAAPSATDDDSLRPNRGGRPTVFTPELKERFQMLLTVGMSRRQAAAYLGLDHTTVAKLAARDPEFRLSLKIAEEQATVNPLLTIISESRKNWRAAAWLLKYRGNRPAEPEPVETVQLTEEEYEAQREREHRRRLADDAREAERDKLRMIAMRETLQASNSPTAPSQLTLSTIREKRRS